MFEARRPEHMAFRPCRLARRANLQVLGAAPRTTTSKQRCLTAHHCMRRPKRSPPAQLDASSNAARSFQTARPVARGQAARIRPPPSRPAILAAGDQTPMPACREPPAATSSAGARRRACSPAPPSRFRRHRRAAGRAPSAWRRRRPVRAVAEAKRREVPQQAAPAPRPRPRRRRRHRHRRQHHRPPPAVDLLRSSSSCAASGADGGGGGARAGADGGRGGRRRRRRPLNLRRRRREAGVR